MSQDQRGFTLVELVAVVVVLGVISVSVYARLNSTNSGQVQASRDDLIAALFFAQQAAMARSNIQLVVTASQVSVTENGSPINLGTGYYPLKFANTVSATPVTLSYDKLGRINSGSAKQTITLTSSSGASANVVVEASGYAH